MAKKRPQVDGEAEWWEEDRIRNDELSRRAQAMGIVEPHDAEYDDLLVPPTLFPDGGLADDDDDDLDLDDDLDDDGEDE